MEANVLNNSGAETGKSVNLADEVFGIEPNDHAVYLDVRQYLANQRQGTHKAKERAEIKGSTKKLKKQKGTGTARAGSIKSPIFRGGGRIFGPRPRNYNFKLNRKLKQLARKSALTYKTKENNIIVVEDFSFENPHTKSYIAFLKALGVSNDKTLLLVSEANKNVYLSARNLKKTKVKVFSELNTYEILEANKVILFESSIEKIEGLFKNS